MDVTNCQTLIEGSPDMYVYVVLRLIDIEQHQHNIPDYCIDPMHIGCRARSDHCWQQQTLTQLACFFRYPPFIFPLAITQAAFPYVQDDTPSYAPPQALSTSLGSGIAACWVAINC
jgi:hypothetical protein